MPLAGHTRCGWIEPEVLGDPRPGTATFLANPSFFHVIHPDWYRVRREGSELVIRPFTTANDPAIRAAAISAHTALWPLIRGDFPDLCCMLAYPFLREAHVQQLVRLVVDNDYAGIDIDYEGLPADPTVREYFSAFITRLVEAMHDPMVGKKVSAAVPGVPFSLRNRSAFDYGLLAQHLDAVHIMTYDFHHGGHHQGPAAPVGWVQSVMDTAVDTGQSLDRFIFGMPNFGLSASPDPATGGLMYVEASLVEAPALCDAGTLSVIDTHPCIFVTDLAISDDRGRQPRCTVSQGPKAGDLFFDDLDSLRERIEMVRNGGFGGVTYWHLGHELPGFFGMVLGVFP